MGCFNSKDRGEIYSETPNPGAVKRNGVAATGANGAQQPPQYLLEAGPQSVLFNPNSVLTPASGNSQNKYAIPNSPYNRGSGGGAGSFIALGANGGSVTGINRRTSAGKGAHVSADLNAIVDDQGTINALVSRQLSVMSHYSVKSEAGSVILQPEVSHGPNALGFTLQKLIGRGGFGNVYLGEWEGRRVAVKVVTGNNNEGQSDQPEDKEWEARKEKMAQMEAILMASVNHPNIVHTLKVIAHQGDAMDPELAAIERELFTEKEEQHPPAFEWHIIMEYCDRGSFSRALAAMRFHEFVETAGYVRWDAWACLETLKEVTKALIFLHENRILHGDLKAANVLLSSSETDRRGFVAKVSDFGLSRVLAGNKKEIKTQTFGTVTHMPPELLSKGILSPSADVYAMGVLLWEAYSGDRVFKQLSDSEVILAVVTRKARPQFPPDTPQRFKYLAERCWAELPEVRPSLTQLYNELENLQNQLCPHGADSQRLLVQSCIKQKRSVNAVPPVQMAGAKGPGQQSRLAQGVSTDGSGKSPSGKGREYNSGSGHHYVGSPLGGGSGAVGSHGPSQADKLKTFAALNRTQQSAAKKSSEYGAMSPGGAGHHPQGSPGSPGPRGLMKVPSLQKTREPELSVSHSAASSPSMISPYGQRPLGSPMGHSASPLPSPPPHHAHPHGPVAAPGGISVGGSRSATIPAFGSSGSLPPLQIPHAGSVPAMGGATSPLGSPNGGTTPPTAGGGSGPPDSPSGGGGGSPTVAAEYMARARTASATGITRPSRFGYEDAARQQSVSNMPN